MHEKLKIPLLKLAKEPLSLKAVQQELSELSDNDLKGWEKDLKKAINRPNVVTSITVVCKYLFSSIISKNKRNEVINKVLQPLVVAQAKLPSNQRDPTFYSEIYQCSAQNKWEITNVYSSWLPRILAELPTEDLVFILNQASPDEFNELFTYFKNHQFLEKLPIEAFTLFLQKLPVIKLNELPLANMAESSESIWNALAAWSACFNQYMANPPEGFWEFVKTKKLLNVPGFMNLLFMNGEATLNFSNYSKDNLHTEIPLDFLDALLNSKSTAVSLNQLGIADQLLAYGLLAVCIGRDTIVRQEVLTNSSSSAELAEQILNRAKTLKLDYEKNSPFLNCLAAEKVFSSSTIETLAAHLNLSTEDTEEYLQIAGCLPRAAGVPANRLEVQALKPKPKTRPMPETIPIVSPSPPPPSSFGNLEEKQRAALFFQIEEIGAIGTNDMEISIIKYVTGHLEQYGPDEQGNLIRRAIELYSRNQASPFSKSLNAEGWVMEAIASQAPELSPEPKKEKPYFRESKSETASSFSTIVAPAKTPHYQSTAYQTTTTITPPLTLPEPTITPAEQEKQDWELALSLSFEPAQSLQKKSPEEEDDRVLAEVIQASLDSVQLTSNSPSSPETKIPKTDPSSTTPTTQPINHKQQLLSNIQTSSPPLPAPQPRQISTQSQQKEPFQFNLKITASIFTVLALILILALCFSPVGAPLWLIPIALLAGAWLGAMFTLASNYLIRYLNSMPPSSQEPYDDRTPHNYLELQALPNQQNKAPLNYSQGNLWKEEKTYATPAADLHYSSDNNLNNNN